MEFGRHRNFRFRSIERGDEDRVREIIFDILKTYKLTLDIDGVDHDLFDIVRHYQSGLFAVVEDLREDTIVGSFALYPISPEKVELRKMYLLETCRRQGIGNWIIDFCIEYSRRNGYKTLTLESASVLKEAIQLYIAKGFIRIKAANHTERCDVVMDYDLTNKQRDNDGKI